MYLLNIKKIEWIFIKTNINNKLGKAQNALLGFEIFFHFKLSFQFQDIISFIYLKNNKVFLKEVILK